MNPIGWLVSFLLPACGFVGAAGLPVPQPMDFSHIERPASPNTALAAPAGFKPIPDIVTGDYKASPQLLYAAVKKIAMAEPRVFLAAEFPQSGQLHFVARSAVFNFPDLVAVQVQEVTPDTSRLMLYSRSVYGESDLGVNRKRLLLWLEKLGSIVSVKG
jgi:uncharacterized protein (DUF1499 family)